MRGSKLIAKLRTTITDLEEPVEYALLPKTVFDAKGYL